MTTMNPNIKLLREWMFSRDITIRSIAERLKISNASVSTLLRGATMPVKRYDALISLGFPGNLLPAPRDRKSGNQAKIPRFPVDEEDA